jgi:hypothetical protein
MEVRRCSWKSFASGAMTFGCAAIMLNVTMVVDASAQTRPALVRDVDTAALQPFRSGVDIPINSINTQALITTVPAGKRLIIDNISYFGSSEIGTQLIFAALRAGQFGSLEQVLPISPPHVSASPSFQIQEGSVLTQVYFEAGEEVWLSVSKNAGGGANINVRVNGHFITP